ncbi:UNVERIFIED_CONTAM: hypothetical protein PYX00_002743 [Menopon gallinae]|uniref:lysozyme n=1 Tax=Menopon gallinae TaxID=328185 RepID=A0AAW2HX90_9NEOP
MDRLCLFTFLAFFLVSVNLVYGQTMMGSLVDESCIGCICEAASLCNLTAGCMDDMCGLFRITWPFWADAGKPVLPMDSPSTPDAWKRCVTDPFCAATTVRNYLTRFSQDCNRDGRVDCYDYAAIHHKGGYGCDRQPWDGLFETRFRQCTRSLNILF